MNQHIDLSPPVFPYRWASDWGEDRYGLWQAFTYRDIRYAFRWLPPGSFDMGSPETEQGRFQYEDLHHVTLNKGFWLAETTVTQALWHAVMSNNPSQFKGEYRPVESVSWDDVQSFIKQLNALLPDLITRLPWEAEWEYACRAGTQTPFNFSGELTLAKANYRGIWEYNPEEWGDGAKRETAEVKTYPCNDWGLYEMHGNIWEWCEDTWTEHLGIEDVIDPRQTSATYTVSARVIRGGSWGDDGRDVRSADRGGNEPDFRNFYLGFRLALGHSG
jgi:formylglycine-generating enzyme required for sulfatase activity